MVAALWQFRQICDPFLCYQVVIIHEARRVAMWAMTADVASHNENLPLEQDSRRTAATSFLWQTLSVRPRAIGHVVDPHAFVRHVIRRALEPRACDVNGAPEMDALHMMHFRRHVRTRGPRPGQRVEDAYILVSASAPYEIAFSKCHDEACLVARFRATLQLVVDVIPDILHAGRQTAAPVPAHSAGCTHGIARAARTGDEGATARGRGLRGADGGAACVTAEGGAAEGGAAHAAEADGVSRCIEGCR